MAQSGRAQRSGRWGRAFKSRRPDQILTLKKAGLKIRPFYFLDNVLPLKRTDLSRTLNVLMDKGTITSNYDSIAVILYTYFTQSPP